MFIFCGQELLVQLGGIKFTQTVPQSTHTSRVFPLCGAS